MVLYGAILCYLVLSGAIWCYLVLSGAIGCYMVLYVAIWCYLVLSGAIWCYMVLCGAVWLSGAIWCSIAPGLVDIAAIVFCKCLSLNRASRSHAKTGLFGPSLYMAFTDRNPLSAGR